MVKLIPEQEITFHDWETCVTVADILMHEGYVVLVSLEEDLYVLNYLWSKENYADRNDVVFMDRDEFESRFYEDPDYEEDVDYATREKIRESERKSTEIEVWYYAKKLMGESPSMIEKIFGLDQMSEEAKDRFWESYPDQLTYDEVKEKYQEYKRFCDAELGERVMEACLAELDRHNEAMYEREKQREMTDWDQMNADQCDGQYVMEEFND